jgi:hypothetical protein
MSNSINSTLLSEFCQYIESNGASESHQNNNLKAFISFAHFLGSNVSFYDIKQNDMIAFDIDGEEAEKHFDKVVEGFGDTEIENVIKNTYCGEGYD